jgi:gamma-D-glutamyl-L-lysine dipeptidyl-peptidase
MSIGKAMVENVIGLLLIGLLLSGCQSAAPSSPTSGGRGTDPPRTPAITINPPTKTPAASTPEDSASLDPAEYLVREIKSDVWDSPENEGRYDNLQTQLILGERVRVLEQRGDWSRIVAVEQPSRKDASGYPGWVRSAGLVQGWPVAEEYLVVMKPRTRLYDQPDGSPILEITLDTRLPVLSSKDGWAEVRLPEGTSAWLAEGDVRITDSLSAPVPDASLFTLAESFLGVPYRWGGTTADAFDCSGITYRIFHAYGITLPRDADDLALTGTEVARADLRKGDMIFTSGSSGGAVSHLGLYWGNGMVLDASGDFGVALRPMPEFFTRMFWITAKRFLPDW